MASVVVDVDDTIVDTRRRAQGIWRHVLSCEVPMEELDSMRALQIFERHATDEQRTRMKELQGLFQDTLLCRNEAGMRLMELDEPVPDASEVLNRWSEEYAIVYLTGRLETLREETLDELGRFGFPLENAQLVMFDAEDWGRAALGDARARLFSTVSEEHEVIRVVDDFPGYFPTYRKFDVPERIGLLRSRLYEPRDFYERGATKVFENWKQVARYL
jgi:hypothetical protein